MLENNLSTAAPRNTSASTTLGEYAYRRFKNTFGQRFSKQHNTPEKKNKFVRMYQRVLCDLSTGQLDFGYRRLERECQHPPSSPAEFRALCMVRPQDIGLPDWYKAYQIAARAKGRRVLEHVSTVETWQHTVIWHTAHDSRISWQALTMSKSDYAIQQQWQPVYIDNIQKFVNGENQVIPTQSLFLPAPPPDAESKAREQERRAMLGEQWAKKIQTMGFSIERLR